MLNKKFLMFLMILGTGLISENNNLVAKDAELKQCEQRLEEANRMLEDANNNVEVASRAAAEYKKLLDEKDEGLTKKRSSSTEHKKPASMAVQRVTVVKDRTGNEIGNKYNLITKGGQGGWNCFDLAVGLENILEIPAENLPSDSSARATYIRNAMADKVFQEGSQNTRKALRIRELLAEEIMVHFMHEFVENQRREFAPPRETMELLMRLVEPIIEAHLEVDDYKHFRQTGKLSYDQYQGIVNAIKDLASRVDVFKSYIDNYYRENGFTFVSTGNQTSIIDVLAEIYPQHQFVIFSPITKLKSPLTSDERVIVPGKIEYNKTVNPGGKIVHYVWFSSIDLHFDMLEPLNGQNQIQRSVSQVQNQRSENQSQIQRSVSQVQNQRSASNKNVQKKVKPKWKI